MTLNFFKIFSQFLEQYCNINYTSVITRLFARSHNLSNNNIYCNKQKAEATPLLSLNKELGAIFIPKVVGM